MTKGRRKRGALDPDYRTKGWNKSAFAPKNSELGVTQLSLAISFLAFFSLYLIPETKPKLMTMQGVAIAGGGAFVMWIVLALLFRRWAWRRVQPRQALEDEPQPVGFEFEDTAPQPPPAPAPQPAKDTQTVSAKSFEYEVAELLNILTPYKAITVGGAGDGGVDVKVYNGERLVGIVQCKRYNPKSPIAPGHVRELYAVKSQFGVKTAYLVTSSRFTPDTEKEAARLGIKLVDGAELERMRQKARAQLRANDERAVGG